MTSFTTTERGFSATDYVVFGALVFVSCAGGIWYCVLSSQKRAIRDVRDYLLGGNKLSTFPIAMSLIASFVSGVTILGTPAEIFNYGSQYWLVVVAVAASCVVVALVYIPVFFNLKLSSSYEYLELRFNRHIRTIASILFLFDEVLYLPMVIYVPALAFNQLTGFNVFAVGGLMVLICGFYTAMGGLRAVVWTDSVQTGVMFLGTALVAIAGTVAVGGVGAVFKYTWRTGRLQLDNWDFSPLERQTGWGAVIGGTIYFTCFNSVNQTMVQRYVSLSTKAKAYHALAIFGAGAILAMSICVWCGLTAWVAWLKGGCLADGEPLISDRLLPAFVTWVTQTQHIPGLSGIFLAGVFGAGLSSLSAVLNACALVMMEDLLRGALKYKFKPYWEGIIARAFTVTLAIVSVLLLWVISKLGGVLGVTTALSAIAASATCGVFTLGMTCWWVGPRGAAAGALAGALVAATVAIGSQVASSNGFVAPPLEFNRDACLAGNSTVGSFVKNENLPPAIFRLSYWWIAPLGLLITLIVGSLVGLWLDKPDQLRLDVELFTPVVWHMLPQEAHDNKGFYRRNYRTNPEGPPARPLLLENIGPVIKEDVANK